MLKDKLPLAFTLLLGIAVANIVAGLICLVSTRYLIKVTRIHIDFLFTSIVAIAFVAAFSVRANAFAIIIVIVFTIVGYCMKKFGYSRPAFLLGFVLGALFERYFFHAFYIHGPFFFVTPIGLVILTLTIGVLIYPLLKKAYSHRFKRS
jgi:TctA family transporter